MARASGPQSPQSVEVWHTAIIVGRCYGYGMCYGMRRCGAAELRSSHLNAMTACAPVRALFTPAVSAGTTKMDGVRGPKRGAMGCVPIILRRV